MIINDSFYKQICKDLNKIEINETVGIEAPTGIGKTYALLQYFSMSTKFRDILYILPTRFACNQWKDYSKNFELYPASYAIDMIIKNNHFKYKTVIIDEAHIDSKEYYSIFLILNHLRNIQHKEITILLVSATIPEFYFSDSFFPNFRTLRYNQTHLFKTTISYLQEDMSINFVNKSKILDTMYLKIIQNYEKYDRILCFLSSHNDCDEIYNRIQHKVFDSQIYIFHGGLENNEKTILKKEFLVQKKYIILTTNIAESSITIPNIDLVIDSCIECKLTYNTFVTIYTSKMSLTQRAGRVGRTKNGHVLRLISEKNYKQDISEYVLNDHNLESIVIKCFLSDMDPINIFGIFIENDIKYLKSLGIHKQTPPKLLQFLDQCNLQSFGSILTFRLMNNNLYSKKQKLFILFLIILIDFYEKKYPKWLYFEKNLTSISKKRILRNFVNKFNIENDLLITQARILLSIFYHHDWKKYATELHFNIKTIREFFGHLFKTIKFLFGDNDFKKNLDLVYYNNIVDIPYIYIEKARNFLWNNNITNFVIQKSTNHYYYYDHLYKPGFNIIPNNTMINPFFTKKDTLIPSMWVNTDLIPSLWINSPGYIRDFEFELQDKMRIQMFFIDTEKTTTKNKSIVLKEIKEEVAYRPNNVAIIRDIEDLVTFVQQFDPSIINTFSI